jgi:uncharacterized protein (TIGR02265 family)
MTQERLVFSPSVEALLMRGVGHRMTPGLQEQLRELGIDLGKPLLPAYPTEVWERAVEVVARALHPDLSMAEAQWKLGESTVYGFEQTVLGKAMVALSKLIGPRRALLRFPTMSKSSNNYSSMSLRELAANDFEVVCEPFVGWSEYVQGCIRAVLDVTGAKDPRVELVSHAREAERIVLRASWRDDRA